jgi:quinolinate synthetase A
MPELSVSTLCNEDYDVLRGATMPTSYKQLGPEELDDRISRAKALLGSSLVILGHHYQRDNIIKYADYRGDSLKLSQLAAGRREAKYIVFCGVHFMAEAADILSAEDQIVILPNLEAGCSMADMADIDQVEACWEDLESLGLADSYMPITYINSAANLKAFVGKHGGAVCTSSNAEAVIRWALSLNPKLLFFPDQHLGRISSLKLGIPLEEMLLWDPEESLGGNREEALRTARVLLWKGHCSVHLRFNVEQIEKARKEYPGIKVIVHPECSLDVVQAADEYGSTERIHKVIRESPPGAKWAVGTEVNLVNRMAQEMPDKTIFCLDPIVCPCSTMYRIHPAYLCWVLENLVEGRIVNQIKVPDNIKHWSKVALDRMLAIS